MIRDGRVDIAVTKIDCCSIVDIERGEMIELSEFISREVLFAKEVSLASFNLRASESPTPARINKFSLVLIIADKEIMKSSLSIEGSRVFLITTIFNDDDVTIADLVKSFESFSLLDILLFLLDNTSNRVISSIEDSKAISARRVLYNIKRAFCNNKSTLLRFS